MAWAKSARGFSAVRLNVAAAIVVVALGGTIGSALAQQRLPIEGLRAPAAVARDAEGIVHVFATSEEDLALAQGWVHARDRLFQMDVSRRQASGTLAELLGQAALPSDVEMRTLGLRRAAACSLKSANEGCPFNPAQGLLQATVDALEAYAKGVNAFVAANGLPPEYAALGLTRFSDWTALDSVTVAKGLAFELSFDLDDLENTEALVAYTTAGSAGSFNGEALFFEDLFRSAPFEPVAVIPSKAVSANTEAADAGQRAAVPKRGGAGGRSQGAAAEMARQYLARVRKISMLKGAFGSMRLSRGSNAWAISGGRTTGSGPLLANDPHLDLTTPSLFYPIHLSAPPSGVDVVGDGFAGLPFILTGRNLRVACGITTIGLDVTDFYAEQVVPDANSPSGLRISHQPPDDALDRVIPIPEVFRFKDQNGAIIDAPPGTVPPATLIVPRRNFGPLLDDPGDGESLSVQYTGFSATRELDAARMMMRARNLNDVTASLQFFDVASQSLTCADSAGRIGYFVAGELPLREDLQAGAVNGLPPFFIRNGLAGNDWLPMANPPRDQAVPFQILPFSEMPQVVDPPKGFIISANNDPLGLNFDNDPLNTSRPGAGGIYYLSPRFNPGLRAFRIRQLLDRAFDIQADVVLHDAEVFLPFIIQAIQQRAEFRPNARAGSRRRGSSWPVARLGWLDPDGSGGRLRCHR
jgi:penicillin amidase